MYIGLLSIRMPKFLQHAHKTLSEQERHKSNFNDFKFNSWTVQWFLNKVLNRPRSNGSCNINNEDFLVIFGPDKSFTIKTKYFL